MAVFRFNEVHMMHVCNPPLGEIWGELDPLTSGPGTYTVVIKTETGAQIAEGSAESADGSPVPMSMPHTHQAASANVHVFIDGVKRTSFSVPICLAV